MAKKDKTQATDESDINDTDVATDTNDESTEGLVKMHKDGTHLHVHPTTVKAHETAGWKLA